MRMLAHSKRVGWLVLGLGLALSTGLGQAGCEEARVPAEARRGEDLESPADAPIPPGGGRAEARVAAAETGDPESCVARLRAELPEEVAMLLEDLGYDAALDEACAAERAVRTGDASGCEGLSAAGLRAGCRRRLAVTHARPDACPRVLDLGREPVCLAWAARDPARCAAAVGSDALVCRAPFERNAQLCRELEAELPRCEAAIARYAERLGDSRAGALPPVEGALRVRFVAAGPDAAEGAGREPSDEAELWQPTDVSLERGVYIGREGCVATLHLASARNTIAHPQVVAVAPLRVRLGALAASLRDARLPAEESVEVGLRPVTGGPDVRALPQSDARAPGGVEPAPVRGSVHVERIDPERGGVVRLRLDLRVPGEDGAYVVRGELATFVRDIDPSPADCASAAAGGGPPAP